MPWLGAAIALDTPVGHLPYIDGTDLARVFELLKRIGYQGVEIAVSSPERVDAAQLKAFAEAAGLSIVTLGILPGSWTCEASLCCEDREVRERTLLMLKAMTPLCARLEASLLVDGIRGFGADGPRWMRERHFVSSLKELAETCRHFGVDILVEPVSRYESNVGNTVGEVALLLQDIQAQNVRLALDCFHANIEEVDLQAAIRTAGSDLAMVHVADSNRWAPGYGHLSFASLHAGLSEIAFGGWLVARVLPRPTPEIALARSYRSILLLTGVIGNAKDPNCAGSHLTR